MNLLPSDKPGRSWRINPRCLHGWVPHLDKLDMNTDSITIYCHILHKHFSMMDNVVVLIQPLPDVMNCHQDSVLKRISGCLSTLTPSWKRWNYMMMRRLKLLVAHDTLWSCWSLCLWGCAIECLWWDTWSSWYWDFRPSQVVSRFYSRQLLVCKHEIAWDSMSINPKMCQTMAFWMGFWASKRFLRTQWIFLPCFNFFLPEVFLPLGWSMMNGYSDCSRVNKSISQLYGILI